MKQPVKGESDDHKGTRGETGLGFSDIRATLEHEGRAGQSGDGWTVAVELQVGRSYRFRYLVDGQQWLNEWHADGWVDNSYGSADSVVDLTCFGQVQRT